MSDRSFATIDWDVRETLAIAIVDLIDSAGGVKRTAHMLGRSDKLLYKWMDPQDEAWPPALSIACLEAHVVKERGKDPVLSRHFLGLLGYAVQKIDCKGEDGPVQACIHALSSCGTFTATVADALEDGELSPKEKRSLVKNINQQMEAMEALRRSLADYAVEQVKEAGDADE